MEIKIIQMKIIRSCVKIQKIIVYLLKLQKKIYKQKKTRFQKIKILEEACFHKKIHIIKINIIIINIKAVHQVQNMYKVD